MLVAKLHIVEISLALITLSSFLISLAAGRISIGGTSFDFSIIAGLYT